MSEWGRRERGKKGEEKERRKIEEGKGKRREEKELKKMGEGRQKKR